MRRATLIVEAVLPRALWCASLCTLFVILSGCAVNAPDAAVEAHRETYSAIAPEYLDYIAEDARLSPIQKQIRADTISTWRILIDSMEQQEDQR